MEIRPKKGYGTLKFGIDKNKVKELVGEPNEIELMDEEEFSAHIWHYWDKGMSIFFDEDDFTKFTSIEIDDNTARLYGKDVFKLSESEIIDLMKANGYSEIDTEVHEWGEKRISFDDAFIDFYFDGDKLSSINFGLIEED